MHSPSTTPRSGKCSATRSTGPGPEDQRGERALIGERPPHDGIPGSELVTFSRERERRLRAGFVGCGDHSWRNIAPAFRYTAVELVAVADLVEERARSFAAQFGAPFHYRHHREMLESHELDVVFIVAGYDPERHLPLYPGLAVDALEAGAHAWIEKPPAAGMEDVDRMRDAERRSGCFVQVGYKKMFTPTLTKVAEIAASESFGQPTQIVVRYPVGLPRDRDNGTDLYFLDHFWHPASIVQRLMGRPSSLTFVREPRTAGSISVLEFPDGSVGAVHMCSGMSATSPLERLEVIGQGANVIVENGMRLTYHRPGFRGTTPEYGRSPTFIGPDDAAPIVWEPEASLGVLYNSGLFLLGYAPEIDYFVDCALEGRRPQMANLDDTADMMSWYEAYRSPEGVRVQIRPPADPPVTAGPDPGSPGRGAHVR